jgi:membrane-bound lytic murein transglycosylase D
MKRQKSISLSFIAFVMHVGLFLQANPLREVGLLAYKSNLYIDTTKKNEVVNKVGVQNQQVGKQAEETDKLDQYGFKNLFEKYAYNSSKPYNSQITHFSEGYMQDYLKKHTKGLTNLKEWGIPYLNLIDNILMQYGLPKELKYLAVIESNLQTSATSWVGAGGPWQFMPFTARQFGLVVNSRSDERRDYNKSTHAAAKYLLSLYKDMQDWLLVIAAYNGGPGRVYSAIKKSGSRNFWDLQYFLPEESRNHVKKFIATHYIMESTGNNGKEIASKPEAVTSNSKIENKIAAKIEPKILEQKESTVAVEDLSKLEKKTITGKYNALVIAKKLLMNIVQFNKYNPKFDETLIAKGQFDLALPSDKMEIFLTNKYQILYECVQNLLGDDDIPKN